MEKRDLFELEAREKGRLIKKKNFPTANIRREGERERERERYRDI